MLSESRILITGGTGSFGNTFLPRTLASFNPKEIIIYSRDEMKQWEMQQRFSNDRRVRFVLGDVRDQQRLTQIMKGVDFVVHAAATKIVPTAEYNPSECIQTNINGAMNVIDAAKASGVKKTVALSTDKACNPINLYGATKLASDKLFIASNSDQNRENTFSVVRYGNVMGSRGSVIPYFLAKRENGVIPITHPKMTRFMISLDDAVSLVWTALEDMQGGEIYVKKTPSINITDIAKAIAPRAKIEIIGIRPGEKMHEQMVGIEDAPHTFSYNGYYKILPAIHEWSSDKKRIGVGTPVPNNFVYSSDQK